MEDKKNLMVNTGVCDVRNITEELLDSYGKAEINTAVLITTPEAQAVLAKCGVEVNTANTMKLEGDIRLSIVNGSMVLNRSQPIPEERMGVMVNGSVTIEAGCEELLKSYAFLNVNGSVTCPESMTGLLRSFSINGAIQSYPDGSILLKKSEVLDRTFHLRARQGALYYAASRIVALSPDIAFDKLAEKNVRFATKQLLVAESLTETAVPLFDEKTDIVVLPDGCAYVDDDVVLDAALVRRYGGKLYVNGSLTINPDSAPLLEQVSFLRVRGNLSVCRGLKDQALDMDIDYDYLTVVGGVLISGRPQLEVSAALLESAEDGVSVTDCAQVDIAEDVTAELLREKLVSISDCAIVHCTREQRPAIEELAQDVAQITCGDCAEKEEKKDKEEEKNTVEINGGYYCF